MPRTASAGASRRKAIRFSAPDASARAAAVISEVHLNPATLVAPAHTMPGIHLSQNHQLKRRIEYGTNDKGHPTNGEKADDDTHDWTH
jgi:hypothetical protein